MSGNHSLRQNILSCLLCFSLLWNAILFCVVVSSFINTFNENSTFYQSELDSFCKDAENQINHIETLLLRSDIDLHMLSMIDQESDQNRIYHLTYKFIHQFDLVQELFSVPVIFFVIPSEKSLLQFSSSTSFDAVSSVNITEYLKNLSNPAGEKQLPLIVEKIQDSYYLVRYRQIGQSFSGYLIPLNGLASNFSTFSPNGNIHLLDKEQTLVGGNDAIFSQSSYTTFFSAFENIPLTMCLSVPEKIFFGAIKKNIVFLLFGVLSSILLVIFTLFYMHRRVIRPITSLQEEINRLKAEASTQPISYSETTVSEIKDVYITLNQYISQINKLKIDSYEKQLNIQRVELQYLRLQLNPHFFLNALKNIYNLAGLELHEQIQKLTISLSHYMRYLFQNPDSLVPLETEIEHAKEYLSLVQTTQFNSISCHINCDVSLNAIQVPVLILQTFLENTVKYACSPNKELIINIKINMIYVDDSKQLTISIYDNGPGYPNDIIRSINQNGSLSSNKIGLQNLYIRLKHLYGIASYMYLYNLEQGGAAAEIIIPFVKNEME